MTQIDWKSELRKVERQASGLPPEPTAEDIRRWRLEEAREKRRREELEGGVGSWTRLLLVAALAGALHSWPYARACGSGLFAFMGAATLVTLGGVWVLAYSWRRRAVRAHLAAFAVALWGVAILAVEVLPRVGYANPDPARPTAWSCAAITPPTPPRTASRND